ncbi:alpha/beta-hydrolase [Trametes gibbosa]|nr:alpha/beta-hydrolase [Trametes gibbosa]
MPTAPVDDRGTVLYYEDSGAPDGSSDYVTVVLIHGTCFHSAVYRPLIPFAAERNLRLVLLNIRDYPGSTPYSAEDFADLRGASREAQERAMQTRGVEIAAFVRYFVESQSTPPVKNVPGTDARAGGGVSILSWSGGNCPAVATFAHADKLDEETRQLLDDHLRSFIMFDPSVTVVGQPRPPGLIALNRNPSAPDEVQAAEFALAVSSYFPPFTLPDSVDPPPAYDPPRRALHLGPDHPVDPRYMPTSSKMAPDVLRSLTYAAVWEESQHLIWALGYDVFRQNLARALYDCRIRVGGGGAVEKVWPALRVHLVWCDMSIGDCLWASAVIHAQYPDANPEHRRPVEFHRLENANHFVHWEEPERFITFLAGIV